MLRVIGQKGVLGRTAMDDSMHSLFSEILGGLVRSMLHDFNGPLSSIIGYSSKNISNSLEGDGDWGIIFEQGKLLCENIRYWQNIARKHVPHFNGDVVQLTKYVYRGFKSKYSSRLALVLDEDIQEENSACIGLVQVEHLYFLFFLFAYFIEILPEEVKGKLIISISDKDNVEIFAELHAENLLETPFSQKLMKALHDTVEGLAIEYEMSISKIKAVLKKNVEI